MAIAAATMERLGGSWRLEERKADKTKGQDRRRKGSQKELLAILKQLIVLIMGGLIPSHHEEMEKEPSRWGS